MEYLTSLKKYIPGLAGSSYKRIIQLDSQDKHKAHVIAVFVNPTFKYLVACTVLSIEVYDLKSGHRVSAHRMNSDILQADFNYFSDFGTILAVACEDQTIQLFEPNELIKLKSINARGDGNAKIQSINVQNGKSAIVGYSNGQAKVFGLKSSKEEHELK